MWHWDSWRILRPFCYITGDSGVWDAGMGIIGASMVRPPKHSGPAKALISLGSWEDVLDPNDGQLVVNAQGNWIARLAIPAILA